MKKESLNIIGNIKIIEELKAELICTIGEFFRLLNKAGNASRYAVTECISEGIMILYILARKLGYSFSEIDNIMKSKLEMGIKEEDKIEQEDHSLSMLKKYINSRND